jgi:hypothetical protein
MKCHVTLFFYFFLLQSIAFGQMRISGKILDEKGKALPGVNVFIKGSYDGATSGVSGNYSFETTETGSQLLVFQFVGFKTQELFIDCSANMEIEAVRLIEKITEMNAVTISAGSIEASDEKKAVILRPLDIVTTPSAMGDIVGAFQTLPGTSTVGNDGRLFVRGGDASEVGIYIDGMRVGNAYGTTAGNVPTRTRFNPNLFKGTFFSTGGYSAEYGQALSSALALNTKDLSLRSQDDLSIMSVGGGYSHTLANEKRSLTVSANVFDLKPYQELVRQNFDWERAPYSYDAELAGQHKLKKGGLLKVLARTETGGMQLWQPLPGSDGRGVLVNLKNSYSYAQSNWKKAYKNGWALFGGVSFSHNFDDVTYDSLQLERRNDLVHLKGYAIKDFSDRISMKTGVEYFAHTYEERLIKEDLSRNFNEKEAYLFSEWDFYLSKKFVLRGGLRAGASQLAQEEWIDPRLSLAFKLSEFGQFSFAAGRFHQLPVDNFRVLNHNLVNSESNHLILNYLYQNEGITFRAETFYKSYDGLVTLESNPQNPVNLKNAGSGFAKGLDVFFRDQKTFKNTDYWITYSFVDSERKYNQFTTRVQPDFAPKHNISVVAKHFIVKLKSQLGASFSFNDGYSYTDPNQPGEMNARTKSFQNLSLSWSYLPKPNLIIHLAVSNSLGRDNVFGYTYTSKPNEEGKYESIPQGQVAPRFLFLGVFLTLSKDKNANQLNNL